LRAKIYGNLDKIQHHNVVRWRWGSLPEDNRPQEAKGTLHWKRNMECAHPNCCRSESVTHS